jgi:DNA-binding transcriptional regulator GbsR (MarR family)
MYLAIAHVHHRVNTSDFPKIRHQFSGLSEPGPKCSTEATMNMANTASHYQATPEMQDLSDQIGEFMYYWGFKRIHGKMWTHLFLAAEPLDAADLVKQMKISKALVSISLRELMDFEVIRMDGKSARGTQLYKTNPDLMSVILSVLRQREKRMLSRVDAAHQTMLKISESDKSQMRIDSGKLVQLGDLVHKATSALDDFIELKPIDFTEWEKTFQVGAMTNGHGNSQSNSQSQSNS